MLSNQTAVEQASVAAERAGLFVHIDNSCDDWDYQTAADYLLKKLRELRKQCSPVCLISGGEVTVKVTNPGIGGRNHQFALACAEKIAGEPITVLSAGTDGVQVQRGPVLLRQDSRNDSMLPTGSAPRPRGRTPATDGRCPGPRPPGSH